MQTIRQSRSLSRFADAVERATPNAAGCFWLPYVVAVTLIVLWVIA